MGRKHGDSQPIGDDSFLDTIANLIGVLIMLVMIVGARSYSAAKEVVSNEIQAKRQEIEEPERLGMRVASDIAEQEMQLLYYERELAYRSLERMNVVDKVNVVKYEIDRQLSNTEDDSKAKLAAHLELSELQRQLADLVQGDVETAQEDAPPAILQHLPTPMAKTVFGQEIHVLLSDKKFSVIPWDELIETLKKEARVAASRSFSGPTISDVIGPISGFTMQYTLRNQSGVMSDGTSTRMGRLVELDKFILQPSPSVRKESLEETLGPGGQIRTELSYYRDKNVTITVWVYPDSFAEFRALKERVFPDGYLCAARPLPFGVPIGASPNGTSSTAQ